MPRTSHAMRSGCSSLIALPAVSVFVTPTILAQDAPSAARIADWIRPRVDNGYTTGIVAARRVSAE